MSKMTTGELLAMKARHAARLMSDDESQMWNHIAALTAERDEARRTIDGIDDLLGRQFGEHVAPSARRDRIDALGRALAERDALRERGRALEADAAGYKGRLTAALQRTSRETKRADVAESALAAIRQRAGDEQTAQRLIRSRWGKGPEAVWRALSGYIVGDDAPAPVSDVRHTQGCPAGDELAPSGTACICGELTEARRALAVHRAPAPLNPDATSEADQPLPEGPASEVDGLEEESSPAQQDWDGQHPHDAPPESEPTTAEAFATALDGLEAGEESVVDDERDNTVKRAVTALSMLERRMGALAHVVTEVARSPNFASPHLVALAVKALTGAPEVYTREDLKAAASRYLHRRPLAHLLRDLAALRGTP